MQSLFEILQPLLFGSWVSQWLGEQAFLSYAFPSVSDPGSGASVCVISKRNLASSAWSLTPHAWTSLLKLTECNMHPASLCLGPRVQRPSRTYPSDAYGSLQNRLTVSSFSGWGMSKGQHGDRVSVPCVSHQFIREIRPSPVQWCHFSQTLKGTSVQGS